MFSRVINYFFLVAFLFVALRLVAFFLVALRLVALRLVAFFLVALRLVAFFLVTLRFAVDFFLLTDFFFEAFFFAFAITKAPLNSLGLGLKTQHHGRLYTSQQHDVQSIIVKNLNYQILLSR